MNRCLLCGQYGHDETFCSTRPGRAPLPRRSEVEKAIDAVSAKVRSVTYKPLHEWTFTAAGGFYSLQLRFWATNSVRPGKVEVASERDLLAEVFLDGAPKDLLPGSDTTARITAHGCNLVVGTLNLTESEVLSMAVSDKALEIQLHRLIRTADDHERDEFLRIGGQQFRNPHPRYVVADKGLLKFPELPDLDALKGLKFRLPATPDPEAQP